MEHRSLSPDFIVSNDDHVGGNKCTRESTPDVAPQELRKEEQMGGPVNCNDSELSIYLQALAEGFLPTFYSDTSQCAQSRLMSIASKSYRRGKQTVLFHGFPSLQMSQNLMDDHGKELLTWFRGDSLAKTSVPPTTTEKGLTERGQDFGPNSNGSLAKLDPSGCWLKTQPTSEPKVLDEFSKIWPSSGMMLAGECFQLKTVEPITSGSECGLLPTPTAHNAKEGGYPAEGNRNTPTLGWVVGGKINPQFTEWMMGWPIGWTDLKPLEMGKFQEWRQLHL